MFRNDFVSTLKSHYTYMATYDKLPLWVALKGLTLGNIAYMILFLNSNIKSNIKMDMQIDSISNDAFDYGIYLLKEIRNNCAHGEMVYRFSKKYNVRYLNVASAVNEFGLNRTDAKYIDVLRVLSKFISKKDLRKIKRCILMFYIHFLLIGRKKIATKILGKMGNSDIKVWMNL
jgi:abortive infection bacteriophage resistance protein